MSESRLPATEEVVLLAVANAIDTILNSHVDSPTRIRRMKRFMRELKQGQTAQEAGAIAMSVR